MGNIFAALTRTSPSEKEHNEPVPTAATERTDAAPTNTDSRQEGGEVDTQSVPHADGAGKSEEDGRKDKGPLRSMTSLSTESAKKLTDALGGFKFRGRGNPAQFSNPKPKPKPKPRRQPSIEA